MLTVLQDAGGDRSEGLVRRVLEVPLEPPRPVGLGAVRLRSLRVLLR